MISPKLVNLLNNKRREQSDLINFYITQTKMKYKKFPDLEEHQKGQLAGYRVMFYLSFQHYNSNNWSQLLSFFPSVRNGARTSEQKAFFFQIHFVQNFEQKKRIKTVGTETPRKH